MDVYRWKAFPRCCWDLSLLWGLPDSPAKADWLTPREKEFVLARLAHDPKGEVHGLGEMFKDWRVWALIVPDFTIVFCIYSLGLWMPQMVHAMGYSIRADRLYPDHSLYRVAGDPVGDWRFIGPQRPARAAFRRLRHPDRDGLSSSPRWARAIPCS